MAESEDELKRLLMRVKKKENEKSGSNSYPLIW